MIKNCAEEIWSEYLSPDAGCPINVDSQSHELTKKNMEKPDRWTFDTAAVSLSFLLSFLLYGTRYPVSLTL